MGRQLIAMRARMGSMFWRKNRLFYRFMRGMRQGVFSGMMPRIFEMPVPVFTGTFFDRGFYFRIIWLGCVSR
jgi:hypothetical protein